MTRKPPIAVVECQPVESSVHADAMFGRRSDLPRAKRVQHAIGLNIQTGCDERGFDLESSFVDFDVLWSLAETFRTARMGYASNKPASAVEGAGGTAEAGFGLHLSTVG